MSGWGCRYQVGDRCFRLDLECRPGIKGCVLHGKVTFTNPREEPATPGKKPTPWRKRAKT